MDTVTTQIADSVEALDRRIAALVHERQALRAAAAADGDALERNRLEIARLQQRLSAALIRRHTPSPAAA